MYDDGTNQYCYFLYNRELASEKMEDGEELCESYDADANLAVIDTEAKIKHLASLDIFSGVTVYVIYICYIVLVVCGKINNHTAITVIHSYNLVTE